MHPVRFLAALAALALFACRTTPKPAETSQPDAAVAAAETVTTSEAKSPAIPLDPDVRVGVLDNGLTYYIRKHEKPAKRANLWLAVNAGSVLEDEDQLGLAHFVEHMAFNGTKRFEKNTLVDFIEASGMRFGADVNAFTSFDETVYMLQVPTDDKNLVSTGFDVLEDWARDVSFDPAEVDKERGVVVEEWRLGRGAGQRIFDRQWPIYLQGSKYADRKPIGTREILEKAPRERLVQFYKDWYRPDLMAVIVVGDFEPEQMEAEIKRRFTKLPAVKDARPRENVAVPLLDSTRAAVFTDPESSLTNVSVAIKGPFEPYKTEADHRRQLVNQLFAGMLRARLDEIRRKPDAPFAFAFAGDSDMGRSVRIFNLGAFAKDGKVDATVRTLMVELERVNRHGFVPSELDRVKKGMLRELERSVVEKDKVDPRRYTFGIVNHYLEGRALPGPDLALKLGQQYLPTITLDEVNKVASTWTSRKDRVIMASGPARSKMPGEKDLLATAASVSKLNIDPYEDATAGGSLMASKPKSGSIVKEEKISKIGVTVWTLSNGAKVVVKPTDFKNDEVMFRAFSPGGHSLVRDKDFRSAQLADGIVSSSGVGEHDVTALQKLLTGKVARLRPMLGEFEEGLRGSASPKDIETFMQLVHLHFVGTRKDDDAFKAWRASTETFVKNRDLNPQQVFFEQLEAASWSNHKRHRQLTLQTLGEVDYDASLKIYRERFADAGDFTFVFVGNIELEQLKSYSTQYLASLPTSGRKETWRDVGARRPKGVKKVRVNKGQDPKSFVMMTFHGKAKWSPEANDDMKMLGEYLSIRLREVLREKMSGVYGAFARGSIERRPRVEYQFAVGFGCGPENVDELKQAVFEVIADAKKAGMADKYTQKIQEQRKRKFEIQKKENGFWIRELSDHFRFGDDPSDILETDELVTRVNSGRVQKAAKRFLNNKRYIDGLLSPESGPSK